MKRSVTRVIMKGGSFEDWNFMVNPIQGRENAVKAVEAWERGEYIPSQTEAYDQKDSSISVDEEKDTAIDMEEEKRQKRREEEESDDDNDNDSDDGLGKTKCCCVACAGGCILFSQAQD